ncbi:MAG: HlyD family type I secretion periplasmic adaptor subunit [Victivallales bacterium]|nr:HlyD family type I secretion periplasmic adaptor subunit [Victivallales bacterium]
MSQSEKEPSKVAPGAIEFLPDAEEISERRLPAHLRIGTALIALIVAVFVAWACIGQTDVLVRASGRVVTRDGSIVMKPYASAVISRVAVRPGDVVEEGATLVEFDPAPSRAELARLQSEVAVLESEEERYTAEFRGAEEFTPTPGPHAEHQLEIWRQRRGYFTERMHYFSSSRERVAAARESAERSLAKYQDILKNVSQIEGMYQGLYEKQVTSYKELLEIAVERMRSESEVVQLQGQIDEYGHQELAILAEQDAFQEEWRNAIAEKLVEIGRELDGVRRQFERASALAGYVSMKAPCRAVVLDVAGFPVGGAVGEAEALLTLVPLEGEREIEAQLRPRDIARVQRGAHARIKLEALPFQRHGTLDGTVLDISPDAFQRGGRTEEGTDDAFYRARLSVSGELRHAPPDFTLLPGMKTEVEIKCGRRRLITYLIYPLIKGLDESFHEP